MSVLNQMSMKLYGKLSSFPRIEAKIPKRLLAVKAVNGATHSQKDSVEAKAGGSSAEMLTKCPELLLGSHELAPRPCIFAVLGFHEMDVLLIGWELNWVPDPGQRLVGWRCC